MNSARHKSNANYGNLEYVLSREKSGKEFVMRLVLGPRVGLKRFFNEVINLFSNKKVIKDLLLR